MRRMQMISEPNPPPASILNVAAYKFVSIEAPQTLVDELGERTLSLGLRGTILIAPEGINFSLAGAEAKLEGFLRELASDPRFAELPIKRSWSSTQPFKKMRVKRKREIVALKRPDIRPDQAPAPRISPVELKAWLDQGRDIVLFDARNEFEVQLGTFKGARSLGIRQFSDLPRTLDDALNQDETVGAWRDRTVVTFCTGGIRCEKAAPLLREAGINDVHQLDGGILAWFEQHGAAHFDGSCFVFDERVALDDLRGRISPRLDFGHVVAHRLFDHPSTGHIVFHEPRLAPGKNIEHVIQH
jgi:UPF0176 protein